MSKIDFKVGDKVMILHPHSLGGMTGRVSSGSMEALGGVFAVRLDKPFKRGLGTIKLTTAHPKRLELNKNHVILKRLGYEI